MIPATPSLGTPAVQAEPATPAPPPDSAPPGSWDWPLVGTAGALAAFGLPMILSASSLGADADYASWEAPESPE